MTKTHILVNFTNVLSFGSACIAAPCAAIVVDAQNGDILHYEECDAKLHPADLTKLLTLYLEFSKIEPEKFSLDNKVTASRKASAELPIKLSLRTGREISSCLLIRATAVMGSNDTSLALAEYISGSEQEFARLMNATAEALGMENSTFLNSHGEAQAGHASTARETALVFRALYFDFPQYLTNLVCVFLMQVSKM